MQVQSTASKVNKTYKLGTLGSFSTNLLMRCSLLVLLKLLKGLNFLLVLAEAFFPHLLLCVLSIFDFLKHVVVAQVAQLLSERAEAYLEVCDRRLTSLMLSFGLYRSSKAF